MTVKVKTVESETPDRHIADDIRFKTDDLMVVVQDLSAPEKEGEDLKIVREYNWDHVVWYEED